MTHQLQPSPHPRTTSRDTIRIAHTARCKLSMAANDPNRNFRFILGHALTLDKLLVRIAEIEIDASTTTDSDSSDSSDDGEPHGPTTTTARRVSFSAPSKARASVPKPATAASSSDRRRSPPPAPSLPHPSDDEEDDDNEDAEDDDDAEDDALSLQRYPSGAAAPPPLEPDNGDVVEESEPPSPTEEELRVVMGGESNPEIAEAYRQVAGCRCHGKQAPVVEEAWEMPAEEGGGGRRAVVRVVA